jgi:hypothetical protein
VVYELARVEERVERVSASPDPGRRSLDPICRDGIFVARVAPRSDENSPRTAWKGADMTAPMAEQLDAVRMSWRLSAFTRLLLRLRIEGDGCFPFLATLGGFAVGGADIVGLEPSRPEGSAFRLREASAWFEQLRGRRLPVTSGGPWQLWSPEIAALRALPSAWLTNIKP